MTLIKIVVNIMIMKMLNLSRLLTTMVVFDLNDCGILNFAFVTLIDTGCGTGCPPQWVDVVHSMAGLVPNVSEPMCEFADKFSPCYHEGDVCPKNLVEFTCCPSRCMPSVDACYHGNPPEFLCVPKSIQRKYCLNYMNRVRRHFV
jgi:hypothetical protein